MGIQLGICTLSDADIAAVLAHPPLIWKVIAPDDPEAYEREVRPRPGLLGRARSWLRPAAPAPTPALSGEGSAHADLDKAWHGLHWLLTGRPEGGEWPLCFLLGGGEPVGSVDVGNGPARVLTSAQVREVAQALEPIDEGWLRARFDPSAMTAAGIYPDIWNRDPAEDDTLGYLVHHYDELCRMVSHAASEGLGLVLYL